MRSPSMAAEEPPIAATREESVQEKSVQTQCSQNIKYRNKKKFLMSWFRISLLKSQILCHVTQWSAAPPISPFPHPPPGVQSYMMCQNRTPLVSARAGSLSLHSKQWRNNNRFITSRGSGGLPSMGSHRVGHDWSNLAAAAWFCGWDVWCGLH